MWLQRLIVEHAHENSSAKSAPFDDTGKLDRMPPFMLGDLDLGLLVLFPLISTWLLAPVVLLHIAVVLLHRWESDGVCRRLACGLTTHSESEVSIVDLPLSLFDNLCVAACAVY